MKQHIMTNQGISVYITSFGVHAEGKNGQKLLVKFNRTLCRLNNDNQRIIAEGIIGDLINSTNVKAYDYHYKAKLA